jgi:hypothetical protein
MAGTIAPEDQPKVAPSYEEALFADLDTALERLPHDRITVQWDVAVEFGALEGAMGPKVPIDQIAPGLVRCLERVPADVPVGMRLCTATTATSTSSSPSRCRCRSTSSTP